MSFVYRLALNDCLFYEINNKIVADICIRPEFGQSFLYLFNFY